MLPTSKRQGLRFRVFHTVPFLAVLPTHFFLLLFICFAYAGLFFFIRAVLKYWFSEVLQFSKLEIPLTWKEVTEQRREVVSLKGRAFINLDFCIHQKLLTHRHLLISEVEVVQGSGSTLLSLRRGLFLASPLPEVGKS